MTNQTQEKKIGLGIFAGISTGIFWGLPFLVPQVLTGFSALEIAFGRFFFFGILSLFFLKRVINILKQLSLRERWLVFILSATGFWLYSIVLFWSVQKTDGVISSLVIGLLPISIPLFTPHRKNDGGRFYFGLIVILLGLINLFLYPVSVGIKGVKTPAIMGIIGLLSCLAMWTFFAIWNSRFLQNHPEIKRRDFASVIGVVSLISILPAFLFQVDLPELIHRPSFGIFMISLISLGIGSSWFANWLWNICSFHCPSEISGPLIVSETIFGLLYSFMFEGRSPHGYEVVSILLFGAGVFLAVSTQIKSQD